MYLAHRARTTLSLATVSNRAAAECATTTTSRQAKMLLPSKLLILLVGLCAINLCTFAAPTNEQHQQPKRLHFLQNLVGPMTSDWYWRLPPPSTDNQWQPDGDGPPYEHVLDNDDELTPPRNRRARIVVWQGGGQNNGAGTQPTKSTVRWPFGGRFGKK